LSDLRLAASNPSPIAFSDAVNRVAGNLVGHVNLNVGSGRNFEPGFLQLDRVQHPGVDVVYDLEHAASGRPLPFGDDTVDFILCSHVLEHVRGLVDAMREFHRVLKPGGHLLVIAPYASSDDAWEDPTHVRAFTEKSFMYFDERLYATDGHAGSYPSEVDYIFEPVRLQCVPHPEYADLARQAAFDPAARAELETKKRFLRNVIQEVHAVLKAVKPEAADAEEAA
jgi:SAM-dependent methyltransferase